MTLARRWRAARPVMAGVHLDSAACSRQSIAAIEAAAQHSRLEAQQGGYVAAEAAQPVLDTGRTAIATLTGLAPDDVVFTTGSGHALDLLLAAWPGERTLACAPGEYGPNLAIMAANGFAVRALAADELGRIRPDALTETLHTDRPGLVHLTGVGSHRGIAQPVAELVRVCRDAGVPVVLDAAQAFGQLDCAVGADAVYSSSRKWLAGPRGVGFLAVRPELAATLVRRLPPPDWPSALSVLASFDAHEASIAARVGFSTALGEYLAAGPPQVRVRLAEIGAYTRERLDGIAGWRVVEPVDEPTAITTLVPPADVIPAQVRSALIAEHGIVTTVAETVRAPYEMTGPVLRVSPHVDATAEHLGILADVLPALSRPR